MSRPNASPGSEEAAAAPIKRFSGGPAASIISYCITSISMTVVNKYVVSGDKWNLNFLFLLTQVVIGATTLTIGRQLGLIKDLGPYDKTKAKQWFPVSLLLIGMIYTGNMALRFLSVPVYTIFKNLTIMVIAYGEVLWFNGRVTIPIAVSFALMVLSSVVAAWADFRYAKSQPTDETSHDSVAILIAGLIWMTGNIFCSAAYALGIRKFTQNTDFTNWDIMFYNNVLSIPVVAVATLALEDWSSDNLRSNFPPETRYSLPIGMIYSGLGALAITYCTAWCIRVTSSTTYAMVGALNKLPLAICGIIFFASPVTVGSMGAIALGFIAGLVYAWAKIKSTQPPPVERAEDPEEAIPLTEVPAKTDDEESRKSSESS